MDSADRRATAQSPGSGVRHAPFAASRLWQRRRPSRGHRLEDAGPSIAGLSDAGPSNAGPSIAQSSDAGPSIAGSSDAGLAARVAAGPRNEAAPTRLVPGGIRSDDSIDLVLVALLELAHRDAEIRGLVGRILASAGPEGTAERLEGRLLERADLAGNLPPKEHQS